MQGKSRKEGRENGAAATKKANFAFVHFNANDPPLHSAPLCLKVNDGGRGRENGFMGKVSNEPVRLTGQQRKGDNIDGE